eukprot:7306466-Lingulodinium_polyedra.AAC.1
MNIGMACDRALQFLHGKVTNLGPSRGNAGPARQAVFGRFARGIRQMLRLSPPCYDLREML